MSLLLDYTTRFYMELKFEWDEHKNELNQKKHGFSFEETKQSNHQSP